MKKFEEEIKGKAETMATQPGCSMTRKVWYKADDIHELSKGWISPEEHQAEIGKLKTQLEKQQPEIPDFVAEVFENNAVFLTAEKMDIISWFNDRSSDRDWDKVTLWARENQDKFIQYVMNWKPIEKRFYLKNKLTGFYLYKAFGGKYGEESGRYGTEDFGEDFRFTQQEIDSMETGSYERIEVIE